MQFKTLNNITTRVRSMTITDFYIKFFCKNIIIYTSIFHQHVDACNKSNKLHEIYFVSNRKFLLMIYYELAVVIQDYSIAQISIVIILVRALHVRIDQVHNMIKYLINITDFNVNFSAVMIYVFRTNQFTPYSQIHSSHNKFQSCDAINDYVSIAITQYGFFFILFYYKVSLTVDII